MSSKKSSRDKGEIGQAKEACPVNDSEGKRHVVRKQEVKQREEIGGGSTCSRDNGKGKTHLAPSSPQKVQPEAMACSTGCH